MSKQAEIREGLKYQIAVGGSYDTIVENIVKYLHEQGVVVKNTVDYGNMDKLTFGIKGDDVKKEIYSVNINGVECVPFESLIEEDK